mmetsp:Transcript_18118/g.20903  ORF Transcript_18118/g.20903 Transcript_18118/m.20903 type:complete len:1221 (+) Transcript_18118:108-3770(+)
MPSPTRNNNGNNNKNRSGRGRGGRGRNRGRNSAGRGGIGQKSSSNPSSNHLNNTGNKQADESVLIDFMPYMRQQHPEATSIFQTHGEDEIFFVEVAREFLQRQKEQTTGKTATTYSSETKKEPTFLNKMKRLSVEHDETLIASKQTRGVTAPIQRSPPRSPSISENETSKTIIKPAATQQTKTAHNTGFSVIQQQNTRIGHMVPITASSLPLQLQQSFVGRPNPHHSSVLRPAAPGLLTKQQKSNLPEQQRTNSQIVPLSVTDNTVPVAEKSIAKEPTMVKPRIAYQPKRIWTRLDQQPGRLFANDVPAGGDILHLRPRQELIAKWILPLKYLRQHIAKKSPETNTQNVAMRTILEDLTVGLFRRGCPENSSNASIISKQILCSPDENRDDYPFSIDQRSDAIYGTVPFYAPRTPGHVIFRLYWQDDPVETLATGPTLFVRVAEEDFEPTLRFILSNFKSRKGSATSLSSLNALSTVLEQFAFKSLSMHPSHRRAGNPWDGAGRAAWGCICESRKVLGLCATEHIRGKEKFEIIEEEVHELQQEIEQFTSEEKNEDEEKTEKKAEDKEEINKAKEEKERIEKIEEEVKNETVEEKDDVNVDVEKNVVVVVDDDEKNDVNDKKNEVDNDKNDQENDEDENEKTETEGEEAEENSTHSEDSIKNKLKEKMHILMGGRASNERKWKDAQTAFANILKVIVSNPYLSLLFRRELIAKIRLEFELWSPLMDSFAPSPFNSDSDSLCVNFNDFPHHVNQSHHKKCFKKRQKMEEEGLGFVPDETPLERTLFKGNNNQLMDSGAVHTFNSLSTAMGKLYEEKYMVSDRVLGQREMVRSYIERVVAKCDSFPQGTRVMIFGSSANGFGSSTSDLDMCLQMPVDVKLPGEKDDPTGAAAMAELANLLEQNQMQNVNTSRLTARIPIIMFHCPRPMAQDGEGEGEEELMECDLSFMNPLAVLNTSLLLSYSRVHPITRVLAAIIKRWAKARDINNPSKHTLSSYGYILMLLHFLTYHRRTGNGLITSVDTKQTSRNILTTFPLLPNLQWVDSDWLRASQNTPYVEVNNIPPKLMKHPLEVNVIVNSHYHRVKDQHDLMEIQKRFPSQDLSLAILLASFFRYYAFEFDYKHHVVSLHSTIKGGLMEREVKAEIHGWRVYSSVLAIEDPFETFYDIAHVVKGGNFHRLRNELAMAYTKIITAVKKSDPSLNGMDLINLICEPFKKEEKEEKG